MVFTHRLTPETHFRVSKPRKTPAQKIWKAESRGKKRLTFLKYIYINQGQITRIVLEFKPAWDKVSLPTMQNSIKRQKQRKL